MSRLGQLIYCSAANSPFSHDELGQLLTVARYNNARFGITGMLLYSEGSFFQVLEGEEDALERLLAIISRDERHAQLTVILREPIARRSFGDWTMGYASVTPQELDSIVGTNDFFTAGESFDRLGPGRAKKLLAAFKHGRWRTSLTGTVVPELPAEAPVPHAAASDPQVSSSPRYTFAFQPIINAAEGDIFSYEALIRGPAGEPAGHVLQQVDPSALHDFDEQARVAAVMLAADLGLSTRLNLNFLPTSLGSSPTAITSMLSAAARCRVRADQLVLEILEREVIRDVGAFVTAVNEYRRSGLIFAIDDFGAGHAGLNLLAEFQPDMVKLDMHLVRGVQRHGPRQAIVRGIARTCVDLGIDIVAEGVETGDEFGWLRNEGIELFQGMLLAKPSLATLSRAFHLPPRGSH